MPTVPPVDSTIRPYEFHGFLLAIIRRTQATDLSSYEERGADVAELRALVIALLEVSCEVLSLVFAHYSQAASSSTEADDDNSDTFCMQIERRMERLANAEQIGDLAFIGRLGLNSRLATVRATEAADDPWDTIECASSACREILKSVSALEQAVCEFEGIASSNSYFLTEVERSVRTRAAYRAFRRAIPVHPVKDDDDVRRRLRLSAIAIAMLIGRDIYPSLRVRDRRQIRNIQERIINWLREDRAGTTRASVGRRIWQDLTSFAELLQQVNHRAELRDHDRDILETALSRCAEFEAQQPGLPMEPLCVCPALKDLLGRDLALDELIEENARVEVKKLRDVLERVQRALTSELSGSASTAFNPPLPDDSGDFL